MGVIMRWCMLSHDIVIYIIKELFNNGIQPCLFDWISFYYTWV